MKELKQKKVIIVGLGFGGIALAKGLVQNSDKFKVSIFERDDSKNSRGQGYTLGLQKEGIDCLFNKLNFSKATSLFSSDSSTSVAIYGAHMKSYPLLKIKNIMEVQVGGKKVSCLIDRSSLRSSLIDDLPSSVEINYSKKFLKYEESEQGVTVYFEDGTKEEGDLLVGADGANSLVRKQRCTDLITEDLEYWSDGGVFAVDEKISKALENNYIYNEARESLVRKSGSNGCSLLCFYDSSANKRQLMWSISMSNTVANEYGLSSKLDKKDLKERTLRLTSKNFEKEAYGLIELTKVEDMFEGYQLYSVDPKKLEKNPLGNDKNSRVTLIGDAAHKTTTHGGLGATQAILDAVSLTNLLVSSDNLVEGLRKYEVEMSKRATSAVKTSVGMTRRIHETSAIKNKIFFVLMLIMGLIVRVIQKIIGCFSK